MKNPLVTLLIITVFSSFCPLSYSQNTFEKGLLWKVSGNGLDEPSYLFGTLHMICPDDFFVFPGTYESLAQSNRLVLELNLSDPLIAADIQASMLMGNHAELKKILPQQDLLVVQSFFRDSIGMEMEFISRIQPFFLVTLVYPHMLQCNPSSYEHFFLQQANEKSLEIIGLETLEEQLHVVDALSYKEQADMLLEVLKNYHDKRSEFKKMLNLYLDSDLQGLHQMFQETDTRHDEFHQRLVRDRNHRWIERIEMLMKQESSFFAVGAGHLPGEEGILQLLMDGGYDLERVVE